MKIFQKRSVAAIVMVACIVLGVVLGQARKPAGVGEPAATTLSGTYHYVLDSQGVISDKTAAYIDAMNDSLFAQTGAQIVVQVVETTGDQDIAAYTEQTFTNLGVGSAERDNGILLVLALKNYYNGAPVGDYYMGWGSGFSAAEQEDLYGLLLNYMEADFAAGDYDDAVRGTFDAMVEYLAWGYGVTVEENYIPPVGMDYTAKSGDYRSVSTGYVETALSGVVGAAVTLLVILLFLWVIADYFRYSRYRRRYLRPGMGVPPVVYYPVFWGRRYRPYGATGLPGPPEAPVLRWVVPVLPWVEVPVRRWAVPGLPAVRAASAAQAAEALAVEALVAAQAEVALAAAPSGAAVAAEALAAVAADNGMKKGPVQPDRSF